MRNGSNRNIDRIEAQHAIMSTQAGDMNKQRKDFISLGTALFSRILQTFSSNLNNGEKVCQF